MNKKHTSTRRDFIKQSALIAGALPFVSPLNSWAEKNDKLEMHVFSKHLQFLDYPEMAAAAAEIGFDGIDLTVRPKGHVLPENAARDLPKAVAAIKEHGLMAKMMATGVNNVDTETNRTVLKTASELGIEYYRLSYLNYPKEGSIPDALAKFAVQMQKLSEWNIEHKLQGSYQNHAGTRIGGEIWEIWEILKDADKKGIGCQFDIRHAVVEGGTSWPNSLRLIHSRINTIVAKDFKWGKVKGKWKPVNTPIGEGMVDFDAYFKLLKKYQIKVPVCLHLEYDLGGAEHGDRDLDKATQTKVFAAMKRDLDKVQQLWQNA